ncbi:BGTF surface domain-containing protein [Halobellus rarus]|uniref:BGTF surface domain-containing protein n=1 Tax=Halobellus rarus TaxID=1126237 RepID=A0ABD6CNN5_9EURY|nr:BGTF surface domain-containing protein [Halobellus rarus]
MTIGPSPPSARSDGTDSRIGSQVLSLRSFVTLGLAALLLLSAVGIPAAAQSGDDAFGLTTESVTSTESQTIRGTSTLDAGTELQIRVQSSGETAPEFLQSDSATVGPNGEWNATFDFTAIETHDTVKVSVVASEDQSAAFETPVRNDQATPTNSSASTPGFGVVVAVTALVGGAFLLQTRR